MMNNKEFGINANIIENYKLLIFNNALVTHNYYLKVIL